MNIVKDKQNLVSHARSKYRTYLQYKMQDGSNIGISLRRNHQADNDVHFWR